MPPICVGTLELLSGTGTDCPNVLVLPRASPLTSRYFWAIVPLPAPFAWVVMSLPAAWLSVAPLPTALLWSTAPALRAKSTAAIAEPVLAITSATSEMIVAGCGLEIFMLQTTPAGPAKLPSAPGAVTLEGVIAADIVHLPPAHHCRPTRTMVLHVLPSADAKVSAVRWSVARRSGTSRGAKLISPIVIWRLPRGAYTVRVVVTMANGDKLSEHRRYRTCPKTT